ncbi:O-acetyl-ADP-ribose deacetylase [Jiella sp. MQZ9-1]|uniref:O-acetyl-ADP-ribose deacetylase n=1 Tax=Jiella flava TaxID=2816857 RepID=A0A939FZX4_9HYPH|nr:O-acetyl-ADP-ribose deacetylase [Jiella flava]MCD2472496.1 O-acetyl-ADP-ribose deacetylase [Jiella flava]
MLTELARDTTTVAVITADITTLRVDAIVNAANSRLAGGGGVDGAIHRAAGAVQLQAACRRIGACPTGEARITDGFDLPVRFIIHAVGPVWTGGTTNEDDLLANAYRASFALAEAHDLKTIAFPAISTGIYGFPKDRAATIAARECLAAADAGKLSRIVLCCFSGDDTRIYAAALTKEATP